MARLLILLWAALFILCSPPLEAVAQPQADNGDKRQIKMNLMFCAERIDSKIFSDFSASNNVKINPIYYTSAFRMLLRVRQSAGMDPIDIVITQYYNQHYLFANHGLQQLNHDLIPNLQNIGSRFRSIFGADRENEYCVPMAGGVLSLVVNKTLIDPRDITGYADLWRQEFANNILIPEDFSSLMPLALRIAGEPAGDNSDKCMDRAWEKLVELAANSAVITNNAVDYLVDEKVGLSLVCNVDAYRAMKNNPDLVMITPQEGFLGWVEALSVPANAVNVEQAHAFINYILRPDVMMRLCEQNGFIPLDPRVHEIMQSGGHAPFMTPQRFFESIAFICDMPASDKYYEKWRKIVAQKEFLY